MSLGKPSLVYNPFMKYAAYTWGTPSVCQTQSPAFLSIIVLSASENADSVFPVLGANWPQGQLFDVLNFGLSYGTQFRLLCTFLILVIFLSLF